MQSKVGLVGLFAFAFANLRRFTRTRKTFTLVEAVTVFNYLVTKLPLLAAVAEAQWAERPKCGPF